MARPHPVVDLATVVADRLGWRVDQPNVRQLLELGQREEQAAVERRELAAGQWLRLALRHQRLLLRLDGLEALDVRGVRRHGGEHLAA